MVTVNTAKIPDGPTKDAIRSLATGLTTVEGQPDLVEHVLTFDNHPNTAVLAVQTRSLAPCVPLSNPCGFVSHQGAGAPGASLDILVLGVSILAPPGPVPIGANPPGLPIPIAFTPAVVVPPGAKLDYIIADGGGALLFPTVNVQWVRG